MNSSRFRTRRAVRWLINFALLGVIILATIVLVFSLQARARLADLKAWHQLQLQHEFHAGDPRGPGSFDEYRQLEERLIKEMRERVLDAPQARDTWQLSRYNPQSAVAHLALDTPYNHSFDLVPAGEPRGSVLLVHGLSDSPYSMRALADTFVAQGYYVVVLRLPGHGTLPSGLLDVTWEDWYAAVVLAAKHAAAHSPGKPFIAGGHSTGAALLTLYSLRSLTDASLPRPADLHLVSAAIGISPFAVLTNILSDLAFIPGFEKSRWLDVLPEYDPYKYNSFPVNAANQIYKLTHVVQETLDSLTPEQLAAMPRVHAYQSVVDSTVTASQVINGLLARLPPAGHELIAFDINHLEAIESLITPDLLEDIQRLRTHTQPFRVTLIANCDSATRKVCAYTREAGSDQVSTKDLPLEWPAGVFSVGHVALPFPIDDPVYGLTPSNAGTQYNIGAVAGKGESGALVVGLGTFARLRSNPFFDVIRTHVVETLNPETP
ncbi:MAG TPA: alpha/beta fold hydrolase [Povalibacter sp.]|nr:alpha/beta fold hydrolase [Povalibacter sp.]